MFRFSTLAIVLAVTVVPVAFAKDATVDVHFDAGKHAKEFESSIQGDAGVNYMLQSRRAR